MKDHSSATKPSKIIGGDDPEAGIKFDSSLAMITPIADSRESLPAGEHRV